MDRRRIHAVQPPRADTRAQRSPAAPAPTQRGAPAAWTALALGAAAPGRANEPEERAADRVADQVMGPGAVAHGSCNVCAAQGPRLQSKSETGGLNNGGVPARHAAGAPGSAGAQLPPASSSFFESRMGASLADVRVHTDASAVRAASNLNARAFTVGTDLYFGAGQYQPQSRQGQHLLAHELAHVEQQRGGGPRRIQRRLWDDFLDLVDPDPNRACRNDIEEAQEWAADGPYPADPLAMPGAGGVGGFSAQYRADPAKGNGVLQISEGVAVVFKDTLVLAGGVAAPHPDLPATPETAALSTRINSIADPGRRAAAAAAYAWTPAEKAPWISQLETLVEQGWGGQHEFFLNQPRWDWLGASVAVDLDIGERAKRATDHMDLETYKTPVGESLRTFDISHEVGSGTAAASRDQSMRLASTTVGPKEFDLLKKSVLFEFGSSTLTPAARGTLDAFITTFNGANAHAAHQEIRVEVIGHTSAQGTEADNQRLSDDRTKAVSDYLGAHGFVNVATRVAASGRGEREADPLNPRRARDQRVDLVVDGGGRMITALHEFGHAFGLDDEYGTVGDPVDHNAWAKDMTDASGAHLPGAVKEHNAGIMSFGNEVRPRHYATFHHALQTITAKSPWSLGPHKAKWQVGMECGDASPPGDWNAPKPDENKGVA